MPDTLSATSVAAPSAPRADHMFPTLTPQQIGRIAAHGRTRNVVEGEILAEPGQQSMRFFVVVSGRLDVVRPLNGTEQIVAAFHPGMFTGEVNLLAGRRNLARVRAGEAGELIEVDREHLLSLIQTDSELSEILMRAFILRRVELIARNVSDVIVIGSSHCQGTLRVREFLTRNGHPYTSIDVERDEGVQDLLDRFHVTEADIPVVICRGETVLRDPSNRELADCLGFNDTIDATQLRDVVIVGAGPAGLAAAVYAASEGLDTLVLETVAPGGQAGSSSKIENYLGFPTGISGLDLAGRAYTQAQKFGANVLIAKGAQQLACDRKPFALQIDGGPRLPTRTVIIASGAQYRRLALENLSQFEGVGIYYGATFMESQLCRGDEVIVIGGGNSAGQAAVFLSQTTRRVLMLVRSDGLARSMSRYLIRRIELSPNIDLRVNTEVVGLEGDYHLERVRIRNNQTKAEETLAIRHLFCMTGASPATQWLQGCMALDDKGFIKTGRDLTEEDLTAAHWPLARSPFHLETSLPGVFAVGDVRASNVKRVASAVGEGAMAVAFVHQALRE